MTSIDPNAPTHYDTLGVTSDATPEQVKAAARKLARQWHPDLHGNSIESQQKMTEINTAADVLTDPTKRTEYDEYLAKGPEPDHVDPDTYEDGWGTEESWDDPDEDTVGDPVVEEELDDEVIDDEPAAAPSGAPTGATQQKPDSVPAPEGKVTATRVRTPISKTAPYSLIPFAALTLIGFFTAGPMFVLLALILFVVFIAIGAGAIKTGNPHQRKRKPTSTPSRRAAIGLIALQLSVYIGAFFIPLAGIGSFLSSAALLQAFSAGSFSGILLGEAVAHSKTVDRAVKPSSLRKDRMVFGPASGHGLDVYVDGIIGGLLNTDPFHSARQIRTNNPAENPYTNAVVLDDRAVLIRTLDAGQAVGELYWRDPAVLLQPFGQQIPQNVITFPTDTYEHHKKDNTRDLSVLEVIAVHCGPSLSLRPTPDGAGPQLVRINDLASTIERFLIADRPQVNHVDQERFLNTWNLVFCKETATPKPIS